MAKQKLVNILIKQGVATWNQRREKHVDIYPDLSGANLCKVYLSWANLSGVDLREANLKEAHLREANLSGANLSEANLRRADLAGADLREACFGADLSEAEADLREDSFQATLRKAHIEGARLHSANLHRANLYGANLYGANLSGVVLSIADLLSADLSKANLRKAILYGANLSWANLSEADLSGADLSRAALVETNLTGATLTGCSIYGTSVWKVQLEGAMQDNLVITPDGEPTITVDNLEVAQFVYLLLNNPKIRDVIDTIAKKVVLILGRFTPERKAVLDALRNELRTRGFLPILFDFDKPASRDITETVSTLAHLARFVIADITDAKSIPQELMMIVPNLPSVPVQPLILESQHEYSMFEYFTRFPWVLPVYHYTDQASLLQSLKENVIDPAEQKAQELVKR